MTDSVQIALITSMSTVLVCGIPGMISAFAAISARKAAERSEKKTVEVAHSIDGHMEELTKEIRQRAFAEGVLQQKEKTAELNQAVKDAQAPVVLIAKPQTRE